MKYSKDGLVYFNPNNHTYWKGDKRLQGVTSFIARHKEKFDADSVAEKFAKKNNLNKEVLLKEWAENAEKAKTEGTALHSIFETYFETGELLPAVNKKQECAINFINDYFLSGRLQFVECESIVYDERLASMRDAVVMNNDNEYFIFDWKNCKEISTNHYGKWMFKPFEFLPDANFYHYSLQLRLYQKMSNDYDIKDCYIMHFEDEKYNLIQADPMHNLKNIFLY